MMFLVVMYARSFFIVYEIFHQILGVSHGSVK